jgi:hypothetical protein
MSQENVEFVKGLFAAGSDMDNEALLSGAARVDRPDLRSRDRVVRRPPGGRTIGRLWRRGTGSRPGTWSRSEKRATVSSRIFIVITFREGKVLRCREFYDEAAALEAVGLWE